MEMKSKKKMSAFHAASLLGEDEILLWTVVYGGL